jgi:hypothetical protein
MTLEYKLEISLQLIEELTNLFEGNEYEQFLSQHLIPIKVELERQLTNIEFHSKIKE